MNVIAYSPFQDGVSAKAVGGSDRAIVSGAAHKPTRLLRRSGAIGFSSRPATTLEPGCAATTLDATEWTTSSRWRDRPDASSRPSEDRLGKAGPRRQRGVERNAVRRHHHQPPQRRDA